MNHIYFWIVTLPGTSLVIKVNWNILKYSSVWFHLIHSRMFLHLVQNPTGNSSDLNHPIHESLWFFTENPLVTGHNYLKLYQMTLINLVHRVNFIRKYSLYEPVFVFVAGNRNSDDTKRYFCVKYQTAVDRWNLFALESLSQNTSVHISITSGPRSSALIHGQIGKMTLVVYKS